MEFSHLSLSDKSSLVGYADDCTYTKASHSDVDLADINSDLLQITVMAQESTTTPKPFQGEVHGYFEENITT